MNPDASVRSEKFPKEQRLCSKRIIDELFKSGESFAEHPIRVVWIATELPEKVPTQVVLSVPKKRIRKAVDRNRIKRQMKEVWRKEKFVLEDVLNTTNQQWAIMLIYTGKGPLENAIAREKIILILQRLIKKTA